MVYLQVGIWFLGILGFRILFCNIGNIGYAKNFLTEWEKYGIYDSEMRKEAKIINTLIKLELEGKISLKDL